MSGEHTNHGWKALQLKIDGMHCANCEVLVERRFKKIAGVRKVKVSYVTGRAEVTGYGDLDLRLFQRAIEDDGYLVARLGTQSRKPSKPSRTLNSSRDYIEIGAVFLVLVWLYVILGQLDLLPQNFALPNDVGYGLAFLVGVVASMSTCIAVTGGLLVAVAAKYNEATTGLSAAQKFRPHIFFNVGRVTSYTLLGGAIGALGSTLTMSPAASSALMIVASLIMIVLGLQMLKLFPWLKALQPRMPKFLAHKIHDLTDKEVRGGAFIFGASTFFLPCGFTQALQLYVLAKGSFLTGALTMLAFSIGTLPALLSLSMVSSFATGTLQRFFLKVAGAAVVLLGLFNIQSGLALAGTTASLTAFLGGTEQPLQPVPIVDGKQIVDMQIVGYRYQPNRFAVVQGVPVEWRIDARAASGCGHILIAPKLHVRRFLPSDAPTVISFTPQEVGEIGFNCAMGMMSWWSKITVLPKSSGKPEALLNDTQQDRVL